VALAGWGAYLAVWVQPYKAMGSAAQDGEAKRRELEVGKHRRPPAGSFLPEHREAAYVWTLVDCGLCGGCGRGRVDALNAATK
jgi:hypothetical protein